MMYESIARQLARQNLFLRLQTYRLTPPILSLCPFPPPPPGLTVAQPTTSMVPFFLSPWVLSPGDSLSHFSSCGPPRCRSTLTTGLSSPPFSDPLAPSCPWQYLPCLLMPSCPLPAFIAPPPPVQEGQTELLIISVWQPPFCALIKGAACGLCVSGLYRRRRWANANITCLIIYVWEMGTKAGRGWR